MIFKLIKQIFNKKPYNHIEKLTNANDFSNHNYLLFYIDNNNYEPNIKTNIVNLSDRSCEKYAQMLFNLNSGLYKQSIFDLLTSLSKQDININAFMENVILNWMYMVRDNEDIKENKEWNDNKPIVSPTSFSKYAK
jgi:hypothetical protein